MEVHGLLRHHLPVAEKLCVCVSVHAQTFIQGGGVGEMRAGTDL